MKPTTFLLHLLSAGLLASCASTARLDDTTKAAITAMSDKLAAAKTLRVKATRTSTSGYFLDDHVAEQAKITAAVSRPNQFSARLITNRGKRTIVYDGKQLLLVDHQAQTHALTGAPPSIDAALRSWSKTYGYTPPLAELLVNDPKSYLLNGVTKGRYAGSVHIAGEETDHYTFEQERLSWDLWISARSGLPKQIETRYPNGEGGELLKQTVTIEKWELNPSLPISEFTITPPNDSLSIGIIPLN